MKRLHALAATVGLLLLLGGCSSSRSSTSTTGGDQAACEKVLLQQLRTAMSQGGSATPATKPPACFGLSDAVLQQLATQAMGTVFGDSSNPTPASSSTGVNFTIPNLTGMRLDQADALAQSVGAYTTPETADGNSPTITKPGDWTVCSQQPAAGTTTTSNGIILSVADTTAGHHC